jgi:hypothetical protein
MRLSCPGRSTDTAAYDVPAMWNAELHLCVGTACVFRLWGKRDWVWCARLTVLCLSVAADSFYAVDIAGLSFRYRQPLHNGSYWRADPTSRAALQIVCVCVCVCVCVYVCVTVIRCNSTPLYLQWVGTRGQTEKERKKIIDDPINTIRCVMCGAIRNIFWQTSR